MFIFVYTSFKYFFKIWIRDITYWEFDVFSSLALNNEAK